MSYKLSYDSIDHETGLRARNSGAYIDYSAMRTDVSLMERHNENIGTRSPYSFANVVMEWVDDA